MDTTEIVIVEQTAPSPLLSIIWLIVAVFMLIAMWKVYTKAGKPGWGCIIPIYNVYLMMKIAGKPGWWLVLCFIPIVNIVIGIIATIGIANNFGKSLGFAVGLILLPVIFYPIIAWGDANYVGSEAPATGTPSTGAPAQERPSETGSAL